MDKIKLSEDLQNIDGLPNQVNLLKTMSIKNQIFYEDIQEVLTGVGRIVKYVKEKNTQQCWVMNVTEGQFIKGKQNGFSRRINSNDGSAIIGFYTDGEPFGKWGWYSSNGDLKQPEGIYYCIDCI